MFTARPLLLIFFGLSVQVLSPDVWAQRVDQVRGDRVLVQTDQLKFAVGQHWEAIDGSGIVIGTLEVLQLRADKAIGIIREGDVIVGANLRLKQDLARPLTADEMVRTRKWFIGLSSLSAAVKVKTNLIETELKGSQWGIQVGADQVLTPRQVLRLRTGFDLIRTSSQVTDSAICDGDFECKLWTHYLTGSLGFVFQVMPEGNFWNAGISTGFSGFLPLSRESDALDASKLSIDGGFEAGAFVHFKTNPITWFEFSAQRVFLRDTDSVRPALIRYNVTWVQNF